MIRDPSDGTVREEINLPANEIKGMTAKSGSEGITRGLPITKEKSEELARLEKSREWLKAYSGFSPSTQ